METRECGGLETWKETVADAVRKKEGSKRASPSSQGVPTYSQVNRSEREGGLKLDLDLDLDPRRGHGSLAHSLAGAFLSSSSMAASRLSRFFPGTCFGFHPKAAMSTELLVEDSAPCPHKACDVWRQSHPEYYVCTIYALRRTEYGVWNPNGCFSTAMEVFAISCSDSCQPPSLDVGLYQGGNLPHC